MFSHIVVGSNDLQRSRQFYDGLFGKPARADDKGRLSYGRRGAVFMVKLPYGLKAQPLKPPYDGVAGNSERRRA